MPKLLPIPTDKIERKNELQRKKERKKENIKR